MTEHKAEARRDRFRAAIHAQFKDANFPIDIAIKPLELVE